VGTSPDEGEEQDREDVESQRHRDGSPTGRRLVALWERASCGTCGGHTADPTRDT
jgi:hypothetical protein